MVIQSSGLDKEGRSKDWESNNREKGLGGNSEIGSGCRADLVLTHYGLGCLATFTLPFCLNPIHPHLISTHIPIFLSLQNLSK